MEPRLRDGSTPVWRQRAIVACLIWIAIVELYHIGTIEELDSLGLLNRAGTSVLLPLAAIWYLWRRRDGAMTAICAWVHIYYLLIAAVTWGPSLVGPRIWASSSPVVLLCLLMGGRLWSWLWSEDKFPVGGKKRRWSQGLALFGALSATSALLYLLLLDGGPYPALQAPPAIRSPFLGSSVPLPFKFQAELPPDVELRGAVPKTGSLAFRSRGSLILLDPAGLDDLEIPEFTGQAGVKALLRERWGLIPRTLKIVLFGEGPRVLQELRSPGLWGVVVVADKKSGSRMEALLWREGEQGIGKVMHELDSGTPDAWTWAHSIRLTEADERWDSKRYRTAAQSGLSDRDKGLALAGAVLSPGAGPKDSLALARHFLKIAGPDRARTQVKWSLEAFPKDPELLNFQISLGPEKKKAR